MDPASDPEELIASSIYWYPLIFPTRTEVLDHLMLTNGNGYEWTADGKIASVFADIEPDCDRLDNYEAKARDYEAKAAAKESGSDVYTWLAEQERIEHARLLAIRADWRNRARTYGPVRATEQGYPDATQRQARMIGSDHLDRWTLLGTAPEYVDPAWQRIINETRLLFADVLMEQGRLF